MCVCVCAHVCTCRCVTRESKVPCMLSMYSATKIDPLFPPNVFWLCYLTPKMTVMCSVGFPTNLFCMLCTCQSVPQLS